MRLSNHVYDCLKWVVMILLPAATVLYVAMAEIWGWPYSSEVAKTSAAICTFFGAILGISTAQYNKENSVFRNDE